MAMACQRACVPSGDMRSGWLPPASGAWSVSIVLAVTAGSVLAVEQQSRDLGPDGLSGSFGWSRGLR